jgi:uncharacterized protein
MQVAAGALTCKVAESSRQSWRSRLAMKESRYNVWVKRPDAAYVFNGVSGAILRIPIDHFLAYEGFMAGRSDAECPADVLVNLIAGAMLVRDDADEIAKLENRYHASRYDNTRFALTVVTSLGCNFDCPYCFEEKHPSILDDAVEAQVMRVVDDQLTRVKSFAVTWFGGEPLVGKRSLLSLSDSFIESCRRNGVDYSAGIVTNGYLLDEEVCRELQDRRVVWAQVGLDGPPEIHNKMRPLASGRGSFDKSGANLRYAVDYMSVAVRVNVDRNNINHVEELFKILVANDLAGRLSVYPGQIIGVRQNLLAPSASYGGCFSNRDFAHEELIFSELAESYGLSAPSTPKPTGAPCTAVRSNEMVVGSKGELYKCWDSVGDSSEVVGHIGAYTDPGSRLAKWMSYSPFENDECRQCIALPVCMGGCAHHAFDKLEYENRCGTFRHTYREVINRYIDYFNEHSDRPRLVPAVQLAREIDANRIN